MTPHGRFRFGNVAPNPIIHGLLATLPASVTGGLRPVAKRDRCDAHSGPLSLDAYVAKAYERAVLEQVSSTARPLNPPTGESLGTGNDRRALPNRPPESAQGPTLTGPALQASRPPGPHPKWGQTSPRPIPF